MFQGGEALEAEVRHLSEIMEIEIIVVFLVAI
jgi:hypothetical protein